jgi:SAM-dependent methyltransferase
MQLTETDKHTQAAYYDDHPDAGHEIARPWDRPRLHQWVIEEKFAKATRDLGSIADRRGSALVVCGGSGLDAELLARRGFTVTTSDISTGAAERAVARAVGRGVEYRSIVADAEQLPFADASFDLVFVHDGLHHLLDPYAAIAEMARVARVAVSITEPAVSTATSVAVQLGIADDVEEVGNRVARLTPTAARSPLVRAGFSIDHELRYALYYRDGTGLLTRIGSLPLLLPVARLGIGAAGRLFGRWGNKLTIIATRP